MGNLLITIALWFGATMLTAWLDRREMSDRALALWTITSYGVAVVVSALVYRQELKRLFEGGYERLSLSLIAAIVFGALVGGIGAGWVYLNLIGPDTQESPKHSEAGATGSPLARANDGSFAYMRPQPPEPDGRVRLAIWNRSDTPLGGVRVRMFETVLAPNAPLSEKEFIPTELQIGTLAANHLELTPLSIYPFDGKTIRMYRFEIISEGLSVKQDLLFRYNDRIKSLDDMTTVTHLPAKVIDGKLQFLINQDWHEWTPPPTPAAPPKASTEPKPVSSAQWRELGAAFKELQTYGVDASWQKSDSLGELWRLRGGPNDCKEIEVLCRQGGTMLMKSPNVKAQLSAAVVGHSDPVWRWFQYLKEVSGGLNELHHGTATNDGVPVETIYFGSLDDVRAKSVRACIDCSTTEM